MPKNLRKGDGKSEDEENERVSRRIGFTTTGLYNLIYMDLVITWTTFDEFVLLFIIISTLSGNVFAAPLGMV